MFRKRGFFRKSTLYQIFGVLVMDEKLNWNSHEANIEQRCKEKLVIFKYISIRKWGANKSLILRADEALLTMEFSFITHPQRKQIK